MTALSNTSHYLASDVGYLRHSCEILIDQLKDVGRLIARHEGPPHVQEVDMTKADEKNVAAKRHLELAGHFIAEWKWELKEALGME